MAPFLRRKHGLVSGVNTEAGGGGPSGPKNILDVEEEARERLQAIWFGAAYFCYGSLKSLHQTYSVQLFLHAYSLPLNWFYIGQSTLGLWNAVDDSLMAWVAHLLHRGPTPALRHIDAYKYGSIMLLCTFVMPLVNFPDWSSTARGIHYVLSICAWDAAISYLAVSHSALGTDISNRLSTRALCKRVEIIGQITVSIAIGGAARVWDVNNIEPFRYFALGMLTFSVALLLCAFFNLRRLLRQKRPYLTPVNSYTEQFDGSTKKGSRASDSDEEESRPCSGSSQTMMELLVETLQYGNFRTWIIVQFCVYCNTLMQTKFSFWFAEVLFRETWADGLQGYLVASANVTRGALSFFVILPLVSKLSLYRIFQLGCQVQFFVCLLGLTGAVSIPLLLPVFFILNLAFTSHKIVVGMFMADIADEDFVVNKLNSTRTSFFFGVRSFFTVWAESLLPMVVVYVLNASGAGSPSEPTPPAGTACMKSIWWGVPMVLSCVQMYLMRSFTLRGDYLKLIRRLKQKRERGEQWTADEVEELEQTKLARACRANVAAQTTGDAASSDLRKTK
mmetsp:Transcript_4296/g.15453  ORF Transcript_4296/g.15453 Transcript_4296/m.15453 type:complete len:561 (+) Transcript_4296:153-1835(+)